MMNVKFYFKSALMILFLSTALLAFGQKQRNRIVKVTGKAQVKMESDMTMQEARKKARELAKINALENAFGTYVEQQADMTLANGNTAYNIIGTTRVKGEWIETLKTTFKDNFKSEKTVNGVVQIRWITCSIIGKARKATPKAQIKFDILNRPDPASRTLSFYDGEQLYVWFKSPVNGYLSIFLEDGQTVYRLLPYVDMDNKYQSGVPVKGDSGYLFFSPETNSFENSAVDEMILNKDEKTVEYNTIYIVFSENSFVKPTLKGSVLSENKILPRSLSKKEFINWLVDNRSANTTFQDKKVKISIQDKN